MSDLQIIQGALEQTARRCRLAAGLRYLWRGLLAGSVVALLAVAAYKILPFDFQLVAVLSLAPVAGGVAGFLYGWLRRPSLQTVARWVDARLGTRERLGTALEMSSQPGSSSWRDLVLADAAGTAKSVNPGQLAPLSLTRPGRWGFVLLLLIFGLGWVPEHRSARQLQAAADRQNIQEAGRQLSEIARRSLEQRQPLAPEVREALEAVQELGIDLEKKALTRDEALQELARKSDLLKNQAEELAKNPMVQNLQQAARQGNQPELNPDTLRKQMEALKKSQGSEATPEQMEKLQAQLEKMRDAAQANTSNQDAAGADARQELAKSLGSLAQEAKDLGMTLPQLDAAIAALSANQTDLFLKDMQAALSDLEKLRETAKNLQKMQAQMEKMGKNLAEQLSQGQVEAAQSTLRKMARELEQAGLAPEEMKKLLQEVQEALDPASKYGDVSQDLKQALKEMQAGQKDAAGKSLQAAADKLDKLMQEMGDAAQMMAALAELNDASVCIGSGQGWKPGKGSGASKNLTRRPGGGVGTWAENDLADSAEQNEPTDNSAAERPDMQARGHSDRESGLVDGLKPDRVKGNFSPGAPMPSITLKGVSIRGQSRVTLQEAAVAAQSEAQSALTQDKVPRAYQGAVKQYFDDLKK
jgi:hypothetical protein